MDFSLGPGVVLSLLVVVSGVTLYFFLKARHLERMAMIEQGMEATEHDKRYRSFLEIKFGMLMVGGACGLLLALLVEKTTGIQEQKVYYPAFTLFCGGLSLIASYFLVDRLQRD